jgi:hypothetical protein
VALLSTMVATDVLICRSVFEVNCGFDEKEFAS